MNEEPVVMKFRVQYKMPDKRHTVTVDHIMDNLKDLLQFLARDGITKDSVEFMYIHYTIPKTNETMEVVAVENGKNRPKLDVVKEPPKTSNVVPLAAVKHIARAVSKPRVKASEVKGLGIVKHGLYTARVGV